MSKRPWIPTPDDFDKIEELASQGMDEQDIAYCLGVHPSTLSKKKHIYDQISQAIKIGEAKGKERVTKALLKNIKKGNVAAQIFYLKAKAGWRDNEVPQQYKDDLMLEEMKQIRQQLIENNKKEY